jgi:hypothetical protein
MPVAQCELIRQPRALSELFETCLIKLLISHGEHEIQRIVNYQSTNTMRMEYLEYRPPKDFNEGET